MSNIVKYPFVNMQGKEARTVSYEEPGDFTPLKKTSKVVIRDAEEVEEEKKRGLDIKDIFRVIGGDEPVPDTEGIDDDGFAPGLSVEHVDEELSRMTEDARAEAERIVAEAREQADQIVADARSQAQGVLEQAQQEGIELGRDEGMAQGIEETARIREQLEGERKTLEEEYQKSLDELEPKFVSIVSGLVTKLTGVLVDSADDIILHLIRCGLADAEKPDKIIVRVSPEDAMLAEGYKDEFVQSFDGEVSVEILGQEGLEKNQCIIEADNQMIDAGIDTQLNNLLTALRFLV